MRRPSKYTLLYLPSALAALAGGIVAAQAGWFAVAALFVPVFVGALGALRARTWGVVVLLGGAVAVGAVTFISGAPPALGCAAAVGAAGGALAIPALVRTDALAAAAWLALASGVGVGSAHGAQALDEHLHVAPEAALTVDYFGESVDLDASYLEGQRQARQELRRGEPRYLTYGLPSMSSGQYSKLLDEELGLRFDAIAGCMVSSHTTNFAAGYNSVIDQWLERRFGPGVLSALSHEANKRMERDAAFVLGANEGWGRGREDAERILEQVAEVSRDEE